MNRLFRSIVSFLLGIVFLLPGNKLFAQSADSLFRWQVSSQKISDHRYELRFSVSLADGWQLYAPDQSILDIATTEIKFPDSSIRVVSKYKVDPKPRTENSALFQLPVLLSSGSVNWSLQVEIPGEAPAQLSGELLFTYGRGEEFYPGTSRPFSVGLGGVSSASAIKWAAVDIQHPVADCGDQTTSDQSLWRIFLLGLLGGLIALLTPCVFPMIPVTVTFFTKRSTSRQQGLINALLYGTFIFLIYVSISLPFHLAGNAVDENIFNNLSTNVWLNLLFFAVFVAFALSFFGLYEIGLPAGLANRMDARSGLGNVGGIFFMAITLAIVSFSCTGPILGTLLVGVADQGAWPLTYGAAGFGLALGLPFALFALFPGWLQQLPRSGSWMTDVKVVLGFIELALAVKFFSNADLVEQWGILKREAFLLIWIVIGLCIVLYLIGWIRFGQPPIRKWSVWRIAFVAISSVATIYIATGLSCDSKSDLNWISGFPPPRSYSYCSVDKDAMGSFEPIHNDLDSARVLARAQGKPILIDFTGWACVNCRRMEEKVWVDPEVARLMRDKFVVVSLYVDDRRKLPLPKQQVVKTEDGHEKTIITVGDQWAAFQIANFGATAQPQYAIIDADGKALTRTKFYTPDAAEFATWLRCGLDAHQAN
ncbi:MAG: protein-disulfide reductase DsbD family protein [Bacteroidota bacterium]